ncbi:MAG: M1 family metallopeptidase, partial [Anaerolineae bacterium]
YTNTEPVLLNQLYFRLFPNAPGFGGQMTVTGVTVNGRVAPSTLLAQKTTLEVPLPRALAPGEGVDLALTYRLRVPPTARSGYGMFAYEGGILTLAGFYPTIPVFDRQGWHIEDTPPHGDAIYTDVALYDVTLTLPAGMAVVTSGDVLTATTHPDGTQAVHAFSGPMRDFFIAAAADYQRTGQTVDGVTVTAYFPAGHNSAGEFVLQTAAGALDVYGRAFGPYPYRALDVVAAPMPATLGGVEYPGVVVLARRYYDSPDDLTEFVAAHEVAHQWWYGLVGNDPVNAPWLDEALTQYTAVYYFEQTYGPQRRAELVNRYFWTPYNQLRRSGADRAVAGPVYTFSEAAYGAVVYGKGPLFFEAVRDELGDARYLAALRAYAGDHRYGLAAPDDLLDVFRQAGGENTINSLYEQWIGGLRD